MVGQTSEPVSVIQVQTLHKICRGSRKLIEWDCRYEAAEGKTFVDICFEYKSWKKTMAGADELISGKLFYADKYEYKGAITIEEENRGTFGYASRRSIFVALHDKKIKIYPTKIGNKIPYIKDSSTIDFCTNNFPKYSAKQTK